MRNFTYILLILLGILCLPACSLIDDDLSNCGFDYKMIYRLKLRTTLQEQLDTELNGANDASIRQAISKHIEGVFTDVAQDVDLSFYVQPDDKKTYYMHNDHLNSNQQEFVFYLPVEQYQHIALANVEQNGVLEVADSSASVSARLLTAAQDTVPSQHTGLFTARLPIEVQDTVGNQDFLVTLYMANCATALVIDTTGVAVSNIQVLLTGTATDFMLSDSVYNYTRALTVRTDEVNPQVGASAPNHRAKAQTQEAQPRYVAYVGVSLPAVSKKDWAVKAYVTLPGGSITETVLSPAHMVTAGELYILKATLQSDGRLVPVATSEVASSVKLDWSAGGIYEL